MNIIFNVNVLCYILFLYCYGLRLKDMIIFGVFFLIWVIIFMLDNVKLF